MRTIKEALYVRVSDPSLNRNIEKYHLPHVWDEVLFNIPELRLIHMQYTNNNRAVPLGVDKEDWMVRRLFMDARSVQQE